MKGVLVFAVFLLAAMSNSFAYDAIFPTYYEQGNTKCARFVKQADPRYFGSFGDKSVTVCANEGRCQISMDHPLTSTSGAKVWLRVNNEESKLPVNLLAAYRPKGYVSFACPLNINTIQFAIQNNSTWDNNGGFDYKVDL